eukprot:5567587-Pyramimonas_sp.AAC.1
MCLGCKFHSSGGQIRGLSNQCALVPSRACKYGRVYLCKDQHPQCCQRKAGVLVDAEGLMQCGNLPEATCAAAAAPQGHGEDRD